MSAGRANFSVSCLQRFFQALFFALTIYVLHAPPLLAFSFIIEETPVLYQDSVWLHAEEIFQLLFMSLDASESLGKLLVDASYLDHPMHPMLRKIFHKIHLN